MKFGLHRRMSDVKLTDGFGKDVVGDTGYCSFFSVFSRILFKVE
jgi:hypothetical protein